MPAHIQVPLQPATKPTLLAAAVVVAGTFCAFWPTLDNGFVNWDDNLYIYENPRIRSFSGENVAWWLTSAKPFYWHPVPWLAHALDHALFGDAPRGHHLTSVAVHALNGVWVLLLSLLLLSTRRRASSDHDASRLDGLTIAAGAACALLFAVHPLRVESVAWASEKKDLLCAFFALPALLCYLRYASAAARPRRRWYGAALALFALSLMCKPMTAPLPLALLLLDAYPLRREATGGRWRALLWEKVPFLALSALGALVTIAATRESGALAQTGVIPLGARVLVALRGLVFYLEKTLWPAGLSPFYPFPAELRWTPYIVSALLLAVATALAIWRWRRGRRCYLVAWLAYLLLVLPVSGLLQAGSQAAADRFAYLPTVALFALLAGGLRALWRRLPVSGATALWGGAARIAPAAAAVLLAALCWQQAAVWRDSKTLWSHVARAFPGRVVQAHNNLGAIYHTEGRLERAAAEYRRALAIYPRHANARNNLGLIARHHGRLDEAERQFKAAIALDRRHPKAYSNLAKLYIAQRRIPQAIAVIRAGLARGAPIDARLRRALRAHDRATRGRTR